MYMEVGPVRVLHPVFEEVVNNCFGLNLYPILVLQNNKRLILFILCF